MNQPLKVGAVSYLNTKPLVCGLQEDAPHIHLAFDLPSRLAKQLAAGQLDLALIPAIEYFRHDNYVIVSDACIACRGPVLSVKLFSRVPPTEIKTLALDEGSRTSACMVQILLHQRFGIRPQLQPLPIGDGLAQANADAVLLIGDRAIDVDETSFAAVWDLGDEWCRTTDTNFVFAMWVANTGCQLGELGAALTAARDRGVQQLEAIAARCAPDVGLTTGEAHAYLRDNLYFRLGPRELRGLQLYYEQAAQLGLAPQDRELRFDDCEVAQATRQSR